MENLGDTAVGLGIICGGLLVAIVVDQILRRLLLWCRGNNHEAQMPTARQKTDKLPGECPHHDDLIRLVKHELEEAHHEAVLAHAQSCGFCSDSLSHIERVLAGETNACLLGNDFASATRRRAELPRHHH